MATVSTPAWDTGYDNAEAVVANLALARIGADPIKDDAESTPASRQVRVVFAQTRDELLRQYDFEFARKSMYLTLDEGTDYTAITYEDDSYILSGFSGLTASALVGQFVTGDDIADGTQIVANSTTTVTVDRYPESDGTATVNIAVSGPIGDWAYSYIVQVADVGTTYASITRVLTPTPLVLTGFSGLTVDALIGMEVSGTGIVNGTKVTDNDATTVTIDTNPTTAGTGSVTITEPASPTILSIIEIGGDPTETFELVGEGTNKRLLCDLETYTGILEVKYVERIVDPTMWDSLFKDAFVLRLASKLAIPLAKRPDLALVLQSEFAAIEQQARFASARQKRRDEKVTLWTDRS